MRNLNKQCRTANGRFGASGGVSRPTLCVEQPLPLSSKPQWNPPPVAKPLGRYVQFGRCAGQQNKKLMGSEKEIWKLILKEIKRVLPKTYKTFNSSADIKQIENLEKQLSVELPAAFKAYLQVFNGQTKRGENFPLVGYNRFLPLKEITAIIKQQIELFGGEEPIGHITENKVKPVFWNNLWIPFAEFNASSRLILDLDAGKNGQNGQVILLYPGVDMESDEIVVALSFDNFGEEFLCRLKNNEFEIENDTIQFKDEWIV